MRDLLAAASWARLLRSLIKVLSSSSDVISSSSFTRLVNKRRLRLTQKRLGIDRRDDCEREHAGVGGTTVDAHKRRRRGQGQGGGSWTRCICSIKSTALGYRGLEAPPGFPSSFAHCALPALLNVQIFGEFSSRVTPHVKLHTERKGRGGGEQIGREKMARSS